VTPIGIKILSPFSGEFLRKNQRHFAPWNRMCRPQAGSYTTAKSAGRISTPFLRHLQRRVCLWSQ